jgi:hypothetical protein
VRVYVPGSATSLRAVTFNGMDWKSKVVVTEAGLLFTKVDLRASDIPSGGLELVVSLAAHHKSFPCPASRIDGSKPVCT